MSSTHDRVPVLERSTGKRGDWVHISLDIQWNNHVAMCLWQARLGITAGFATDAGFTIKQNDKGHRMFDARGRGLRLNARAGLRHNGSYTGGRFASITDEESDPAGGRVISTRDQTTTSAS